MTTTSGWNQTSGWALAVALPLLLAAGVARHVEPHQPPVESRALDPYRISVDVDLVVLHATVRDRKGRLVSELREQDFEIHEDGVRQSLRVFQHEDTPVTVGLIVDHSGSMRRKMADVIVAARTFVQSSNPEDEMFVVNFNENVSLGLPSAMRFTNRSEELEQAISRAPTEGKTALYDAVGVGLERLRAAGRDKKVLIVISDGGDNASARKLGQILKLVEQSSVLVYTIGIFDEEDEDRNPGVLNRLAHATGGEAYFPAQLDGVVEVCSRIARDIRHQYTLGYVSTNQARPGTYRSIRVTAGTTSEGKLSVRARTGYLAAGEALPVKAPDAK